MIDNFMTTDEAAKHLHLSNSFICRLCLSGKLQGAKRLGKKMWLIPETSVQTYTPGLRGFAAIKARRLDETEKIHQQIKTALANHA